MEENESVQPADNGTENKNENIGQAEEKHGGNLSESKDNAKGENVPPEDPEQQFRQAVLRAKQERAARAEGIISLVAGLCGADKSDYDGIESAVSERNFECCRKNDMEYRLGRWQEESEEVKQMYPEFDLAHEMSDRKFFSLCYKGVGLAEAYLIVHKDELFTAAMEYAAAELMRSGAFGKPARAKEGALSAVSEVSKPEKKLSKSERKELIRRTERGERVVL